jgi:hypothetical protein
MGTGEDPYENETVTKEVKEVYRQLNGMKPKERAKILEQINDLLKHPNSILLATKPPLLTNKIYHLPYKLLATVAAIVSVLPFINSGVNVALGIVARHQQAKLNAIDFGNFDSIGGGLGAVAGVVANQCNQNNNAWSYCQPARSWAEQNIPGFQYQAPTQKTDRLLYELNLDPVKAEEVS